MEFFLSIICLTLGCLCLVISLSARSISKELEEIKEAFKNLKK